MDSKGKSTCDFVKGKGGNIEATKGVKGSHGKGCEKGSTKGKYDMKGKGFMMEKGKGKMGKGKVVMEKGKCKNGDLYTNKGDVAVKGNVAAKGDVKGKVVAKGYETSKGDAKGHISKGDVATKGNVAATSNGDVSSKGVTFKGDYKGDPTMSFKGKGPAMGSFEVAEPVKPGHKDNKEDKIGAGAEKPKSKDWL